MEISEAEFATIRARLLARRRSNAGSLLDVRVRPISEAWRLPDRVPAFKTAVANVAYIWRRTDAVDRFGPTPARFAERRCELHAGGLMLPGSAPVWAMQDYSIWAEADAAVLAGDDLSEVAAWHAMLEIPATRAPRSWQGLVTGFIERELVAKGAAVAWAIHALEGEDGWITRPHVHCIVTGRGWRRDRNHGRRQPAWLGNWNRQAKFDFAWQRQCADPFMM